MKNKRNLITFITVRDITMGKSSWDTLYNIQRLFFIFVLKLFKLLLNKNDISSFILILNIQLDGCITLTKLTN